MLLLLFRLPWRPGGARDPAAAYLTWVATGLLVWEAISVAAGGSYWLHYLVGMVPGLVLVLALGLRRQAAPRHAGWATAGRLPRDGRPRRRGGLGGDRAGGRVGAPRAAPADEQAVIDYLRAHREGPRTGVVAFGDASLLEAAGLSSPYPYLWSLPVRVRDPGLRLLDRVLRGEAAPTWIVRHGSSLASWGIDADRADQVLGRRYTDGLLLG